MIEHKLVINKWKAITVVFCGITYGNLENVPVDKTYQNRSDNKVYVKLRITERGLIREDVYSLYRSSKKGYYCVVCGKKCYFDTSEVV